MKFLINQGQAIRSVFGRSRVIHFMRAPFSCGAGAWIRDLQRRDGVPAPPLRLVLPRAREPPRPARRLHQQPRSRLGHSAGAQSRLSFTGQQIRFLIRDRDSTYSGRFDEVFRSEKIRILQTPVRAPKANAIAERFVRTVRAECLDWLLILNRRHLERVLRTYTTHYNRERPHRALALLTPTP